MKAWVEYSDSTNRRDKLFAVGQLALSYKLRPIIEVSGGSDSAAGPEIKEHKVQTERKRAADSKADEDNNWDAFIPSPSPVRPAGTGETEKGFEPMDYSMDTQTWILSEAVKEFICQPASQQLIPGVDPVS